MDYSNLNRATLNDTTISLLVSTLDLSNCFHSIELDEARFGLMRFRLKDGRAVPKSAGKQIVETFSVKVLTKFLILKNKTKDFPFTHFGQFLSSFVDDLACFTKKG